VLHQRRLVSIMAAALSNAFKKQQTRGLMLALLVWQSTGQGRVEGRREGRLRSKGTRSEGRRRHDGLDAPNLV